jgi:hypothetical protein
LYWKDEFEMAMNSKQLVVNNVAQEEFKKRVKESFNQAPNISISSSLTNTTT